jgi:hypothetical protein
MEKTILEETLVQESREKPVRDDADHSQESPPSNITQ